jgi:hypothetical protein
VLALPLAPLGAAAIHRLASAQSGGLNIRGDCTEEPALQMMMDFATGNLDRLPYRTMDEFLPGADWEFRESVELGMLLVPPGWNVQNVQANSFSRNGVPEWQSQQLSFPYWGGCFIISPDESAAYIYISGRMDGPPFLDGNGLVELARTSVMGSDNTPREVCVSTQDEPGFSRQSSQFVVGDRYGRDLIISRGFGIQSEVSGATLGPGTEFGFEIMAAPRRESAELMEDVFIKIMWQLIPRSGSGDDEPTPTPSPTPIG